MAESNFWKNNIGYVVIDVQRGAGNEWRTLDVEGGIGGLSPSGGGVSVESEWGSNARGGLQFLGTRRTSNPERITFDLMARMVALKHVQGLLGLGDDGVKCDECDEDGINIRARYRCGDKGDPTAYDVAIDFLSAGMTSRSTSAQLANNADNPGDSVQETASMSAGLRIDVGKLMHLSLTGAVGEAVAINDIAYRCNNEYWAVTNGAVGAPGRLLVLYVAGDEVEVIEAIDINTLANTENATSITFAGGNVLVASPDTGVQYARVEDVLDGVATPFTLATGFTVDQATVVYALNNRVVFAAGVGGIIFRSGDGGYTFDTVDNGVATTEDLVTIDFNHDGLGWFGGTNGALVRYQQGTFNPVVITGPVLDDVLAVAAPPGRNQLFLSTDAGEVYMTERADAPVPEFVERPFAGSGTGEVPALEFVGYRGQYLFIVQNNAAGESRVLRDISGGQLGRFCEVVGAFGVPDNDGILSLAVRSPHTAVTVGSLVNAEGFVGSITYNGASS